MLKECPRTRARRDGRLRERLPHVDKRSGAAEVPERRSLVARELRRPRTSGERRAAGSERARSGARGGGGGAARGPLRAEAERKPSLRCSRPVKKERERANESRPSDGAERASGQEGVRDCADAPRA